MTGLREEGWVIPLLSADAEEEVGMRWQVPPGFYNEKRINFYREKRSQSCKETRIQFCKEEL